MEPEAKVSTMKRGLSSSRGSLKSGQGSPRKRLDDNDRDCKGTTDQTAGKSSPIVVVGRTGRTPSTERRRKESVERAGSRTVATRDGSVKFRGRAESVERRRRISADRSSNSSDGDKSVTFSEPDMDRQSVSVKRRASPSGSAYSDKDARISSSSSTPKSPRGTGGGVMMMTKSFEAKTSMIRRRDSDGSLMKNAKKAQTQVVHNDGIGDRTKSPRTFQKAQSERSFKVGTAKQENGTTEITSSTVAGHTPVLDMSLKKSTSDKNLPSQNGVGSKTGSQRKDLQLDLSSVEDLHEDHVNNAETVDSPVEAGAKSDLTRTSSFEKKAGPPISPRKSVRERQESPRGSMREVASSPRDSVKKPVLEKKLSSKPLTSPRTTVTRKSSLEKRSSSRSMASPRDLPPSPRDGKSAETAGVVRRPSLEKKSSVRGSASPSDSPALGKLGDNAELSRKPSFERKTSSRTLACPRDNPALGKSSINRQSSVEIINQGDSRGVLSSPRKGYSEKRSISSEMENEPMISPRKPPLEKKSSSKNLKNLELKRQSSYEQIDVYSYINKDLIEVDEEMLHDYGVASTVVRQDSADIDLEQQILNSRNIERDTTNKARSETEVQSEKAFQDAERVWLVHKGGFASASLLKMDGHMLPEGRVQIKLDHGGEVLEVDEDDVEKANPPQLDRAEDLSLLRNLNESSSLHTVRQRFGGNLTHTYAGPSLIVINPMQPLQIYSDKVVQMFKGCKQEDMPPHIFALAQIAYRDMLNTRSDQSVVMMGRSGSGKTYNSHHVLHYFTLAASSVNNILTVDKLNSMLTLLDAFGNSRTILNTNASRFAQLTTLDFDHSGQIVSASVQVLLFEKTRVVRRPEGEPTFHIFYQLLAGVDAKLRSELQLNSLNEPNLFMTPLQKAEDKQRAVQFWSRIHHAMEMIQMTDEEIRSICSVLAAIYHLGVAGATKGNNNKGQFGRPAAATKAATLLGISVEELGRTIFSSSGTATLTRNTSMRSSPGDKQHEAHTTAIEALEGFVIGLYSDVFNAVVSLINRSLSSNYRSAASVTVVDTPGFQNPATCGRQTGATFDDLCYNYTQEKLQLLFHDIIFTNPQDRYSQENVECDFDFVTTSPAAMVSLIEKPSQQSLIRQVRTANAEIRDAEKKGLLWILDEEAIFPGATEDSFMDRFFTYHGEQKVRRDSLLRKASSLGNTFILNHFQGTNPVQYNASGWLKVCRENPISKMATQVLQESKKSNIKDLFSSVKAPVGGMVSGSIVGMEGSNTLRRVGSMRRTFMSGTAGLKKRSSCLLVKFQVDSIIETVRKTTCHFVHCILPQTNAGLSELRNGTDKQSQEDNLMNVPLVRAQVRGSEILESVRIHRQGFPDHIAFGEFIQRFDNLIAPSAKPSKDMPEKSAVIQILEHLDIDKLNYRIGLSRVFFRAGALNRLDSSRDDRVTGVITSFQAYCRGFVARKKLVKLKIQHVAISCIQKNVRKFAAIRDWDWWKLYIKVKPLLNVHRTEEELRDRELELEQMKTKLERVEKERNEYKQQMDKLENRLVEMTADLAEETTTAGQATEMLETESADRMRLEKDLKDVQGKYAAIRRNHEKLEMEMMQVKLWQAETINGDMDDDEVDGGVYKERYERLLKELAFTKKQLQQQHEEEIEQERISKKNLEKRIHEAIDETEDVRRQLTSAKKKSTRLMSEMQDMKLHMEDQTTRNNDLERKQRKFDTELSKALEDVKIEHTQKERLQREKDELVADKYGLEKDLQHMKMDVGSYTEKYEKLQRELGDMSVTGNKDHEVAALKKVKNELESKVLDQEEELDDQAGQIQQLDQAKVRLEMTVEKTRQQHMKELEDKEQEMEDLRYSTQKKLKQMEVQVEEEYEERKSMAQKNRDLERQLQELQGQTLHRDKDAEKRLRRDLKKTKALLKDSEVVIEKLKGSEGSKVVIRQLRNQLDDAQYASSVAVKAKKTMELEIQDLQQQLDDLFKSKQESENKVMALMREKSELQSQLEENEEDMADILKKYKAVVNQQSVDQITMADQLTQIEELTNERDKLRGEVNDLKSRMQTVEESTVEKTTAVRLENKIRDLEAKLDLEVTLRHRLEVQINRSKEAMDHLVEEKEHLSGIKQSSEEKYKQTQRQLRDMREEFSEAQKKEFEFSHKSKEMENKVAELEADYEQNQSDLKLAFKRISDLQSALEEDLDSDIDISDSEELDDSDGSDIDSFLSHHGRLPLSGGHRSHGGSSADTRSRVTSASSSLTDGQLSPRLGSLSTSEA